MSPTKNERSKAAQDLGRRGGLKGGKARAESMTKEQRSEIASRAAAARWGGEYAPTPPGHDVHHDQGKFQVPEGTSIARAGTYTPAELAAELERCDPAHTYRWDSKTQRFDVEAR